MRAIVMYGAGPEVSGLRAGEVAQARAYIEELLPDVLDGTIEPGRVFDQRVSLDGCPAATARWPTARPRRCSSDPDRALVPATAGHRFTSIPEGDP